MPLPRVPADELGIGEVLTPPVNSAAVKSLLVLLLFKVRFP